MKCRRTQATSIRACGHAPRSIAALFLASQLYAADIPSKNRGAEAILLNMLDPKPKVNPQYVNYVAVLNDGRTLTGIIAAATATGITLKRTENATGTIQRSELKEIRSTRQSIMPEGLEKQLIRKPWRT
jgi:putative heme-binding domain-containing protein